MSVLVICYHNINKNGKVTPETFEENLKLLKSKNYFPATIDDVYGYITGKKHLPDKAVHITFDDGHIDNYTEAFPIMRKFDFKATIFLITSRIGILGCLDWNKIHEMNDSGIFNFESHTHSHPRYSLVRPAKEKLIEDLTVSKDIIRENLKKETRHFCYPYGEYDNLYIEALKAAGFLSGFTLDIGVNTPGQDPYLIKRIDARGPASWLRNRLKIYSSPVITKIYRKVRGKI
ncbi:MAG: polysaccharide deacetylase family protein [Elusimicrobia bacterium]|nr:polysaccharide deacetylase family protein [Elusimicrobiota bacterium]